MTLESNANSLAFACKEINVCMFSFGNAIYWVLRDKLPWSCSLQVREPVSNVCFAKTRNEKKKGPKNTAVPGPRPAGRRHRSANRGQR